MARQRVTGIFKACDADGLLAWYAEHLGLPVDELSSQEPGPTVPVLLADLDAVVRQLQAVGIAFEIDPETCPNGRFAQVADPEGNAVHRWEPA